MAILKDPERKEMQYLHQFVQLSGKSVLEIGSGDGRLTWRYAADTETVTGVDLDMQALRTAINACPVSLRNKVTLARASAISLPHPHAAFDLAILAWSL